MTFTHLDESTDEAAWQAELRHRRLPELPVPVGGRLVVIGAHPDDETLGAGALIAAAARQGARVDVVVASDGEASHPDSPTHTPDRLRARRRDEVAAAVRVLAPAARLHLLGLPDGALEADREKARAALASIIDDAPDTLLVAPWCGDGHTDHEALGRLAHEFARERGLRLLEYPIWLWHWAQPGEAAVPWGELRALRPGAAALEAKRAAMAAHVSQTQPLSGAPGDESLLSPAMQTHFDRPEEIFVEHTPATPLTAEFFTDFYRDNPDPWGFETRWYEERKRAVTLAALPRRTFRRGLEVGCATGVLTAELSDRVESLLGVDIAEAPLERARRRLAGRQVAFERRATPGEWPSGEFDLVVLSEVGYYWGDELGHGIRHAIDSLAPDGVLLACHWRHPVAEYPLSGDEVHRALREHPELVRTVAHEEEDFLLDVFTRPPAVSVARETGLV